MQTARRSRPISCKISRTNSSNSRPDLPLRQPIPITMQRGIRCSASSAETAGETVKTFPSSKFFCSGSSDPGVLSSRSFSPLLRTSSSGGSCPARKRSCANASGNTRMPFLSARRRALKRFAFFRSSICSPLRFAKRSTANMLCASVAVVRTASAPVIRAILRAQSLAPPRCPDRMGITWRPFSSMTSTAGSISFPPICGAMVRTVIPQAPMNRRTFPWRKFSAVHSCRIPFPHTLETDSIPGQLSAMSAAILPASSPPAFVK